MKLTHIQIDEFGIWRDLDLPVNQRGLTVFYGPNEAGKSTLMRFIRGMFYGFDRNSSRLGHNRRAGTMSVLFHGQHYQLNRIDDRNHDRSLQINGESGQHQNERLLNEFLQDTTPEFYENIYAIGLRELQELSTLQSDEVTDRIYGLTLGPKGKQLIQAERIAAERKKKLFQISKGGELAGQFVPAMESYSQSKFQQQRFEQNLQAYRDLLEEEQEVRVRIADQKKRQAGLHSELRGHKLLLQAWLPWSREQKIQKELNQLPDPHLSSSDRIQAINALEQTLNELERQKSELRGELRGIKATLTQSAHNPAFKRNAHSVRALLEHKEWIENAEKRLGELKADSSLLKVELDEKVDFIGKGWDLNRLQGVDTSPKAHFKLVETARSFQASMSRRARRRKKYQKLSDNYSKRQAEFDDRMRKFGIKSLEKSIADSDARVKDLEQLSDLRIREAELSQQAKNICRQLTRLRTQITLPWWAWLVLWVFGLCGVGLFIAGLYKSVTTAWFIGLIYVLTGIVCGGLTWALRMHYESDTKRQVELLQSEQNEMSRELAEVKSQIDQLMNRDYPWLITSIHNTEQPVPLTTSNLIADATRHSHELRKLKRLEDWIAKTRHRLSVLRGTLPHYQREVSNSRQRWCQLLKEMGLDETVRVNEAFDEWLRAYEADQSYQNWNSSKRDISRQQELLGFYRERMNQLAARLDVKQSPDQPLVDVLSRWQDQLEAYELYRDQYTSQRQQWSRKKKQWDELSQRYSETSRKLKTEFRRAGVRSRTGLDQLLKKLQKRDELEAALRDVQQELSRLSAAEPDLAIVESDLLEFDEQVTREHVEYLSMEIEDLENDLQTSHANLGTIQEKRLSLEQDRTEIDARSDIQQKEQHLITLLEEWIGATLAEQEIVQLQKKFERTCQPKTLKDASGFLARMTHDRYQHIWAKLGGHHLQVDNAYNDSFPIAQLSSGTREQLFLALRLAMIEELREKGVELPVILDDVFVNFDQDRTEAAVRTLIEFAETGQQILLFTCHQYLAEMFRERGVETFQLPQQQHLLLEQRAG